jgi:AraC family transcriptional regulator of adaptative response/methylated-DNA-[protein]-cysteine methyltransferase
MKPESALHYTTMKTPIGDLLVIASDKGLCGLKLVDRSLDTLLKDSRRSFKGASLEKDDKRLQLLTEKIQDVLAGRLDATKVPLDMRGTPFQEKVWQALARVPWGKTATYSDLARKAGAPKAIRAVASACARNPVAFVVPCHRILRKGGGLGGYYWGTEMKQKLLEREQA